MSPCYASKKEKYPMICFVGLLILVSFFACHERSPRKSGTEKCKYCSNYLQECAVYRPPTLAERPQFHVLWPTCPDRRAKIYGGLGVISHSVTSTSVSMRYLKSKRSLRQCFGLVFVDFFGNVCVFYVTKQPPCWSGRLQKIRAPQF